MEFRAAEVGEFAAIFDLYRASKQHLRSKQIKQWDFFYPNRFVIKDDLRRRALMVLWHDCQLIGAVCLDQRQAKQYAAVKWIFEEEKAAVIHRLVVHPDHQGRGWGKQLLRFCEMFASERGFASIRLDAYSGNRAAIALYEMFGYQKTGEIRFPLRRLPYFCYEKAIHADKR
ncbi:GNAT family N-acetyltransferase [Brevibacillus fulvus]|uniref:Ribosomal protein S18 acetylase RimI-like enzyme n=1 Tax=Brevibacillus fulvus TaxID=1125967 RepID=A0A939BR61_9BACL|nr:GNAT family N-acetyltransferase [Brevibacillus fulvus]MBM7589128.1 ribosomal protein S18 acetylase RimI-like enzyme [Brevibacillus fulvus]